MGLVLRDWRSLLAPFGFRWCRDRAGVGHLAARRRSWRAGNGSRNFRRWIALPASIDSAAPCASLGTDVHDHDGDVVLAAGLVGRIDQTLGCDLRVRIPG